MMSTWDLVLAGMVEVKSDLYYTKVYHMSDDQIPGPLDKIF